MRVVVTRKDII